MPRKFSIIIAALISLIPLTISTGQTEAYQQKFLINDKGYFESENINFMIFDDFYPEGHQGGITIIQNGNRVAANGDIRLEPSPGQWSPTPKLGNKIIDKDKGIIKVNLWFPDSSRDRKGFNPIVYPDLKLKYLVSAEAVGNSIKLTVDLEKPLPKEWENKVGFNLEIFPGDLFGEHYLMDGMTGIFPRQANGPLKKDSVGNLQVVPIAEGKKLVIAPGNKGKEIKVISNKNNLLLLDGRGLFNNGWFILRSDISAGVSKNAVEWIISPTIIKDWRYDPVIQVSQIGYQPKQNKIAVIELDRNTEKYETINLIKTSPDSEIIVKSEIYPKSWGNFLRYKYLQFDFSEISDEGLYKIKYGQIISNEFEIKKNIYSENVWQPTIEYFLPVQMCHMKIKDRYKVWHGLCHMDDAQMAPINCIHFDGYYQGASTLTKFSPGEHVPGLNIGGWHDAGDYDLRLESQASTVYKLCQIYELTKNDYDETTIDETSRLVEINKPDGKSDILQQIEHGLLSIIGGYESMGTFYRGIISSSLDQYTHLGDASTMTDNLIYKKGEIDPVLNHQLPNDDQWVFTEKNPERELYVAQVLAASSRVLNNFNPDLAEKCLVISKSLLNSNPLNIKNKLNTISELFLTDYDPEYAKIILANVDNICSNLQDYSELIGRISLRLNNKEFTNKIEKAVVDIRDKVFNLIKDNPYGVPYRPFIWGSGWTIQSFGIKQLYLHLGFPEIYPADYFLNSLNFVLGCHPGENTSSFISGVGVKSPTVAYGTNRDEWSYIPGGVISGTSLIRPDLPELKVWPYFWQQAEYVMGGGALNFVILVMAADYLLNKP